MAEVALRLGFVLFGSFIITFRQDFLRVKCLNVMLIV